MNNTTMYIIGKGPGIIEKIVPSEFSRVAALNSAANLIDGKITWLFCNDVEAIESIYPETWLNVQNLVCPVYPHQYNDVVKERIPAAFHILSYVNPGKVKLWLYNLHTAPAKLGGIPDFGEIWSVAETAVSWLLYQGWRDFVFTGVSHPKNMQIGYSPLLKGEKSDNVLSWYETNYIRIEHRLKIAGATFKFN